MPLMRRPAPTAGSRSGDQLREVAQSHANLKIVGSYSGLLIGAVGKTPIEDLAIMRAMPDVSVLVPVDATELLAMMEWNCQGRFSHHRPGASQRNQCRRPGYRPR